MNIFFVRLFSVARCVFGCGVALPFFWFIEVSHCLERDNGGGFSGLSFRCYCVALFVFVSCFAVSFYRLKHALKVSFFVRFC